MPNRICHQCLRTPTTGRSRPREDWKPPHVPPLVPLAQKRRGASAQDKACRKHECLKRPTTWTHSRLREWSVLPVPPYTIKCSKLTSNCTCPQVESTSDEESVLRSTSSLPSCVLMLRRKQSYRVRAHGPGSGGFRLEQWSDINFRLRPSRNSTNLHPCRYQAEGRATQHPIRVIIFESSTHVQPAADQDIWRKKTYAQPSGRMTVGSSLSTTTPTFPQPLRQAHGTCTPGLRIRSISAASSYLVAAG